MKELSLHILDLVENSLKAEARNVEIIVKENTKEDLLKISIIDDGKGMSKEFLENVTDPFTTTRRTRSVGLGISLTKAAAERCNGSFEISSQIDKGTEVEITFQHSNIDRAPLGNMGQTISTIINQCGETEIAYNHTYNDKKFTIDTREIKEILDGVSIKSTNVLLWIIEFVNENIKNLYKY
ncbi:sensor histidine kinase [Sporosalibacterium faouarense]|uniref:sensor histidine kinase n=1 Tax=Sporosalibacterium faouarense TaxID=516123 RepID=UPI00141D0E62|nr:ATP-binding protein [Sporosalibacterium faouarense]MTI48554.1 sensor histidine kinase [Bacillota bacterium]